MSALALLALLGLLLIGAVASASMAHRALGISLSDGALLAAADYAVGEALSDPARFGLADLSLQTPQTTAISVPGAPGIRANLSTTRLPAGLYWLVGTSESGDADIARRRVGMIARTEWIGPPPKAPFVARGSTQLSADVVVLADTVHEPDCSPASIPSPVQTADSGAVFAAGGQWAALAMAPGVRATVGDTTITGGSFEGILMVAGNLVVDGPFEMTGLIVARGTVRSTVGFQLRGSLVSQAGFPASIDLHGATVRYAPCLVSRLLRRASPLRAVRMWGWSELF